MSTRKALWGLFCVVVCASLACPGWSSPYFLLENQMEWEESLMLGNVRPLPLPEWDYYMTQWDDFLVDGEPYPDNIYIEPQLYVYGGGGSGGVEPNDAGLVMYWDAPPDPTTTYSAAWQYDYQLDPNLSNSLITITVTAPQFDMNGNQVNNVSFGIQDTMGNIVSWHWKCGPGWPIMWNVPTQITINTANIGWGLAAATPPANGFMMHPNFNITQSQWFIVDENASWVGGPNPVPPPGMVVPGMWNYWHNLLVTPVLPPKGTDPIKWSQPPVVEDPGPPPIFKGWDEKSLYQFRPIVADDWRCDTEEPVTDIHWWGSFLGWDQPEPPQPMPVAFHIGIWSDVPAGPDEPFSHPGQMLWEHYCDSYQWNFAGFDRDPRNPDGQQEPFMESCFQFVQYLPQEAWFYQQEYGDPGTIFWLSIAAIYQDDVIDHPWGWKTREHFFMDDAVRIHDVFDPSGVSGWPPHPGWFWASGVPIQWPEWPMEGETWDVAFELTTRQEQQPYNDLGDAPDSSNSFGLVPMTAYPTMGIQANFPTVYGMGSPPYGPIHLNPLAVAYLGKGVTLENEADLPPDQDPTTNIEPPLDVSDKDLRDDSIRVPLTLPHCTPTSFTYTVTIVIPNQQLYVNVWADWNRDGDWDDTMQCPGGPVPTMAPEWCVQNHALMFSAPGTYTMTTPQFVPWHPNADPDPIWMRITLSEQPWQQTPGAVGFGGSGPSAGYMFGETEDYYFTPQLPQQLDWGDAPDPYPTTSSQNGANHVIVPGMLMGVLIDAEPDGQPHPTAEGDDLNNLADEDGASGTPVAPGCPLTIKITVTMDGYIDAWIDYGGDGSWAQPEDQIFNAEPVTAGDNYRTIMVPNTAVPGMTFARVRYSSVGGLPFDGPADDGEVEDYRVDISDPPREVTKAEAKKLPIGTDVLIRKNVVTANFGVRGWYFEESDPLLTFDRPQRFAAIGVLSEQGAPWNIGDIVTTYGYTVLNGCELMIQEYASILEGEQAPLEPLGQNNRDSGGQQFGFQPGLINECSAAGVKPAYGLNTVAMLVRLWGRATCVEDQGVLDRSFWIDDGSNLWDGSYCPGTNQKALGVKVRIPPGYAGPPIVTGGYYAVTGIMRTYTSPGGCCARWLWPRMSSDITFYPEP